jgi:hypothetical protein
VVFAEITTPEAMEMLATLYLLHAIVGLNASVAQ